jgi:excisionase family DNA binding protein
MIAEPRAKLRFSLNRVISIVTKHNESVPNRRLLKTKDAARYLSVSKWKLRQLVQDGALPFIRDTEYGPWLIDIVDLDQWVTKSKQTI